jgi:hypothetical protein
LEALEQKVMNCVPGVSEAELKSLMDCFGYQRVFGQLELIAAVKALQYETIQRNRVKLVILDSCNTFCFVKSIVFWKGNYGVFYYGVRFLGIYDFRFKIY